MDSQLRKIKTTLLTLSFQIFCLVSNFAAFFFLAVLLYTIADQGFHRINADFFTSFPSRFAEKAGIYSSLVGTILMMLLTAIFAIPLGLGAAIYLEEYSRDNRWVRLIKLNIQNLAGVPSIIYGILGLTIFVRGFSFGRSLLAGSLTMALLILPIITIAAQEALKAVPQTYRLAGFGIGMTRWQVIYHQVLPVAFPGMVTGIILALSRAIGESAPLIMIGALTFVAFLPSSIMDSFTVLSIQIFNWTSRPQQDFQNTAAAAIIVLIAVLLLMNSVAIYLRMKYARK